jgi:hypothetical protein
MEPHRTHKRFIAAAALVVLALAAGMPHEFKYRVLVATALMINYARSSVAPPGTLTLEMAPRALDAAVGAAAPTAAVPVSIPSLLDWPTAH